MNALLHRAEVLFDAGLFAQAKKVLCDFLAKEPNNSEAHALLCLTYTRMDQMPLAISEGREAVRLNPDSDYANWALSVAHYQYAQYDKAFELIEKCIAAKPLKSAYLALASDISYCQKKYDRAMQFADKAVARNPQNVDALGAKARAHLGLNQLEDAENLSKQALAIDPNDYGLHWNLGDICLRRKNAKEASKFFKEALRLSPGSVGSRQSYLWSVSAGDSKLAFYMVVQQVLIKTIHATTSCMQAVMKFLTPHSWRKDLSAAELQVVKNAPFYKKCLSVLQGLFAMFITFCFICPIFAVCEALDVVLQKLIDLCVNRAIEVDQKR